jgi:hypothetical protein
VPLAYFDPLIRFKHSACPVSIDIKFSSVDVVKNESTILLPLPSVKSYAMTFALFALSKRFKASSPSTIIRLSSTTNTFSSICPWSNLILTFCLLRERLAPVLSKPADK